MIRKILKNNRGSYYVNIPKELMREIKWKDNQKVVIDRQGNNIVVADWKK